MVSAHSQSRRRSLRSLTAAVIAAGLALTACGADGNDDLAQRASNDGSNYIAGDGSVQEFASENRGDSVAIESETFEGESVTEETFQDLRNLGLIFGVTDRAATIIEEMQTVLTEVEAAATDRAPRRIFVYSQGEDAPVTTPGLTIATDLIARAGGQNIFADLRQPPTTVSWEQVIDRDPECIVIVDHGPTNWEEKRDFLRDNPAFGEITAIQDNCFLPLPYAAVTPGIRNADAVRAIAELLHDDAFDR